MQLVITWEPEFPAPFFRLRLLNDETGVRSEIDELAVARPIAPDSCTVDSRLSSRALSFVGKCENSVLISLTFVPVSLPHVPIST